MTGSCRRTHERRAPRTRAAPFRCRLVVMAKAPVAGLVKTRLAREMGVATATRFARHATAALLGASPPSCAGTRRSRSRPIAARRWRCGRAGIARVPQGPRRPRRAHAAHHGPHGAGPGRDHRHGRARHTRQRTSARRFACWAGTMPCSARPTDGGYWLVGLRGGRACSRPFGAVRWSTPACAGGHARQSERQFGRASGRHCQTLTTRRISPAAPPASGAASPGRAHELRAAAQFISRQHRDRRCILIPGPCAGYKDHGAHIAAVHAPTVVGGRPSRRGEGRLDLAAQFYRHLTEHYAYTRKPPRRAMAWAASARRNPRSGTRTARHMRTARCGRPTQTCRATPRRRPVAPRDHYRTGRALARLVSAAGLACCGCGLVAPAVYGGLVHFALGTFFPPSDCRKSWPARRAYGRHGTAHRVLRPDAPRRCSIRPTRRASWWRWSAPRWVRLSHYGSVRACAARRASLTTQPLRRCSSRRGMISTKLQGRWRLSSCH